MSKVNTSLSPSYSPILLKSNSPNSSSSSSIDHDHPYLLSSPSADDNSNSNGDAEEDICCEFDSYSTPLLAPSAASHLPSSNSSTASLPLEVTLVNDLQDLSIQSSSTTDSTPSSPSPHPTTPSSSSSSNFKQKRKPKSSWSTSAHHSYPSQQHNRHSNTSNSSYPNHSLPPPNRFASANSNSSNIPFPFLPPTQPLPFDCTPLPNSCYSASSSPYPQPNFYPPSAPTQLYTYPSFPPPPPSTSTSAFLPFPPPHPHSQLLPQPPPPPPLYPHPLNSNSSSQFSNSAYPYYPMANNGGTIPYLSSSPHSSIPPIPSFSATSIHPIPSSPSSTATHPPALHSAPASSGPPPLPYSSLMHPSSRPPHYASSSPNIPGPSSSTYTAHVPPPPHSLEHGKSLPTSKNIDSNTSMCQPSTSSASLMPDSYLSTLPYTVIPSTSSCVSMELEPWMDSSFVQYVWQTVLGPSYAWSFTVQLLKPKKQGPPVCLLHFSTPNLAIYATRFHGHRLPWMSQPSHLSLMPPKTPYYALVVTQMDPPSFPACFERHQSGDTTLLFFSHVTPAYQAYAALYPHVTWVTTTSTVFVGGLRHPVHPSEIAQVFHSIGWVHQVHVLPHKRCAFVSFFLNEHAQAAVTLQRVKIGENWASKKP